MVEQPLPVLLASLPIGPRGDDMDKPDSSLPEDGSSSIFKRPIGRRDLLKGAGALGVAGLAAPLLSAADAFASRPRRMPIKHIVVDMQENRSFDHYYGFASFAGRYGVPSGYFQPDGQGGKVVPYHFTSLSTPDIGHGWGSMHGEVNGGAMDGFFTTAGTNCMGDYTPADLPFYYSLF